MTTAEMSQTQAAQTWDDATPEEAQDQKLRLDMLTAFHVASKGARFFPRQNESVIKKIEQLLNCIRQLATTHGGFVLELVHSFLMLNGTRIKTDVAGMVPYNYVMETLQKLHCGGIMFDDALTFDELREFLYVFAKMEPADDDEQPFNTFRDQLARLGLRSVTLAEEDTRSLASQANELRQSSVDIYFKSISVAKNVLENAHAGKAVNFRRAKRAVQTMVDITAQDRFFLLALTNIKNYDEYTYNHSTNVAVLAITFGQHLGMSRRMLGALGMAAMFHDIGKTDIDHHVLNKEGKLSRDEWDLLKSHPVLGVKNLLKSSNINDMLIRSLIVAFEHHKHIDLRGYPETNYVSDINFLSRLVSICDVFDALTTPRIYRSQSYSAAEAFSIMLEDSGTAFDPVLLNEFIRFLSLYPVGTMLRLSTGETAVVVKVKHDKNLLDRPFVKIIIDADDKRIEPLEADLAETDPDSGAFLRNPVEVLPPGRYFENLQEYFDLL